MKNNVLCIYSDKLHFYATSASTSEDCVFTVHKVYKEQKCQDLFGFVLLLWHDQFIPSNCQSELKSQGHFFVKQNGSGLLHSSHIGKGHQI